MLARSTIAALISGAVIFTGVLAGEVIKFKARHNNVVTKWESSEMVDEPGHIRRTFELKGIGVRRDPDQAPC